MDIIRFIIRLKFINYVILFIFVYKYDLSWNISNTAQNYQLSSNLSMKDSGHC